MIDTKYQRRTFATRNFPHAKSQEQTAVPVRPVPIKLSFMYKLEMKTIMNDRKSNKDKKGNKKGKGRGKGPYL